ncbi:MAG: precorrin-8X methylmutase [Actinomycetota bacterium]|nr:precorrin-8X methylmutase [Actinomycetota bacterium]
MLDTGIILVGHGSRVRGAEHVLPELAAMLSRASGGPVDYAYMQFAQPTLAETIDKVVKQPLAKIILLPVFISNGQHVTSDIPMALKPLCDRYKSISFLLGEPLGPDYRLVEILNERLMSLQGRLGDGAEIAAASFRLIESSTELPVEPGQREIAKRVVHATGDPSLGRALLFSDNAVAAGLNAIKQGKIIVTDVRMVKAGISADLLPRGNTVVSGLEAIEADLPASGLTRCARGIRDALRIYPDALIAVGNAPTALSEVCRMIDDKSIEPPLVVGTPVGFVGAAQAKEALTKRSVDFITLPGTRGGSPVAAAIINALAKLAGE